MKPQCKPDYRAARCSMAVTISLPGVSSPGIIAILGFSSGVYLSTNQVRKIQRCGQPSKSLASPVTARQIWRSLRFGGCGGETEVEPEITCGRYVWQRAGVVRCRSWTSLVDLVRARVTSSKRANTETLFVRSPTPTCRSSRAGAPRRRWPDGGASPEVETAAETLSDPRVAMWIVAYQGRPFPYAQDYSPHDWDAHAFAHLPGGSAKRRSCS